MTIWQPGMRCVCVDGGYDMLRQVMTSLTTGAVYTIAEIVDGIDGIGLALEEVEVPNCRYYAFRPSRFRPLSETRLNQFRQHLTPLKREREMA